MPPSTRTSRSCGSSIVRSPRLSVGGKAGRERGPEALGVSLDRSRTLLLIVAIASLLAAGGIGMFYVRRHLVRRLIEIGSAMRRLSSGDVGLKVPATADRDEIGEMARALEVFRDGE